MFPAVSLLACFSVLALGCTGGGEAKPAGGQRSVDDQRSASIGSLPEGQSAVGKPAHFPDPVRGGSPNEDLRPIKAMFATECEYSHSSNDDPIVFPGEQGAAHHHDFFGNTTTDFTSTVASLDAAESTTCRMRTDTAAYWAPALSRDGAWLEPLSSDAYYRVADGVDVDRVQPYPPGLMMISGDGHAEAPQDLRTVAWACDRSIRVSVTPPSCPDGSNLTVRVTFQDCWDGKRTDSDDHRQHVAYSGPEGCPASHPVAMPQLTFVVHYPHSGPTEGLGLSPGSILGGHADFVNTWDQQSLQTEIDKCLKRAVVCDPPGGTGGSPPTF